MRRRKVWRVAAGYSVVGWLIIQFATTVFPALALPVWTTRLVIISVLAGFPIALSGLGLRCQRGRHRKNTGYPIGRLPIEEESCFRFGGGL